MLTRFAALSRRRYLNGPLRDSSYGHGKKPHPLPVTMAYLAEGIKKLRAVYVKQAKEGATKTTRLWRGMRNLDVGDKFLADRTGGTEARGRQARTTQGYLLSRALMSDLLSLSFSLHRWPQ